MTVNDFNGLFPSMQSPFSRKVFDLIEPDIRGPPSLIVKQLIVQSYSPKISVLSTSAVDKIANQFGFDNFLKFLTYFEDSLMQYDLGTDCLGTSGSPSRIVVRFVKPAHEQLKDQEISAELGKSNSSASPINQAVSPNALASSFDSTLLSTASIQRNSATELFDLTAYHEYMEKYVKLTESRFKETEFIKSIKAGTKDNIDVNSNELLKVTLLQNTIYLKMLSKLLSSNQISSFEYFNHPIMQLLVISPEDDITNIRKLVTGWKDYEFPKWFDADSIVPLFLIIVDNSKVDQLQKALKIQEELKISFSTKSIVMPIEFPSKSDSEKQKLHPSTFAQIEQDLQCFSLGVNHTATVEISKKTFEILQLQIREIIYKVLLPFMENKIKIWNDEVVAPRKSLTGRLFSSSKRWGSSRPRKSFFSFGSTSSAEEKPEEQMVSYNNKEGYYYKGMPEMMIRRLADWYFMLRDYKSSYITYDLIKKDLLNDKAYTCLSSLQEFSVASLLIGAINKINPLDIIGNNTANNQSNVQSITPKLISDIITPLLESTFYSYLSRCNLKTFTVKVSLVIAELYFTLGQSAAYTNMKLGTTISTPGLTPETYFTEAMKLFKKIIDSKLLDTTSTGFLMERVAYIYYCYDKPLSNLMSQYKLENVSYYEEENQQKLKGSNMATIGLQRSRKSILWMLLASKELDPVSKPLQVSILVWKIEKELGLCKGDNETDPKSVEWLARKDGLLYDLKKKLKV